ncbi:MAG: hypothetical protein JST75_06980 [Bacteroidetes bacterium]|nr:hypothetical protein [Bacteroidota bacterium]
MENINQQDSIFTFSFDEISRRILKKTATWAKICAICAFVAYAVALVAAFTGGRSSTYTKYLEDGSGNLTVQTGGTTSTIIGTFITVIIGCVINYYLLRFANLAGKGVDSMNQPQLNDGLGSLRIYFKILGIILLIVLIIFALAFVAAMFAASLSRK